MLNVVKYGKTDGYESGADG